MIQKKSKIMTSEEIFNDMCNKIEKIELPPGTMISESEVCKIYGVSRTVIRAVFSKLKELSLITVFPQRGTYISLIDLNHISDILFVRAAIEKEVLNRVMRVENKKSLIEKLKRNIESQKKCCKFNKYDDEFSKLDTEFHHTLSGFINRENIYKLIDEQYIHVKRWRYLEISNAVRIEQLIDEHENIFKGIEENDISFAIESLNSHLDTVTRLSESTKEKCPEYFL